MFDIIGDILGYEDMPSYPGASAEEQRISGLTADWLENLMGYAEEARGGLSELIETPQQRVARLESEIEAGRTWEAPTKPTKEEYMTKKEPQSFETLGTGGAKIRIQKGNPQYKRYLKQWEEGRLPGQVKAIGGAEPGLDTEAYEAAMAKYEKAAQRPDVGALETELESARGLAELSGQYQNIQSLTAERQLAALRGELDLPTWFETEKAEQEKQLQESMSRKLGSGWEQTTPGIQARSKFEESWTNIADQLRRGEIAQMGEMGLSQQQLGLASQAQQYGQLAGLGTYGSELLGGGAGLLGYYSGERAGQYGAQAAQMASQNQLISALLGGGMQLGGAYYMGQGLGNLGLVPYLNWGSYM